MCPSLLIPGSMPCLPSSCQRSSPLRVVGARLPCDQRFVSLRRAHLLKARVPLPILQARDISTAVLNDVFAKFFAKAEYFSRVRVLMRQGQAVWYPRTFPSLFHCYSNMDHVLQCRRDSHLRLYFYPSPSAPDGVIVPFHSAVLQL